MALINRSVPVGDRRTSVRLEPEYWKALTEIARRQGGRLECVLAPLIAEGDAQKGFTSRIRIMILTYFQAAATEDGHHAAGHGCLLSVSDETSQTDDCVPMS